MEKNKISKTSAQTKKRVFIIDDHPPMRQGLAQLINEEPDLMACGGAGTAQEALADIQKLKPDAAIVDMTLKDSSGLDLIKDLRRLHPKIPALVVSMHSESLYAERAIRAGARGYIMKEETTEKVIQALRQVLSGEIYLSEIMSKKMLQKLSGAGKKDQTKPSIENLSDRELEVFRLIGQGHPTREIARKLHLSSKTVESYREHIKLKLNLKDAAELTQAAIQWVHSENLS